MLHLTHKSGQETIQLTEIHKGLYELTLDVQNQGRQRTEKTASLKMAMFMYLQCIASEISIYGETCDEIRAIEDMVVPPKPGTW